MIGPPVGELNFYESYIRVLSRSTDGFKKKSEMKQNQRPERARQKRVFFLTQPKKAINRLKKPGDR